MKTREWLAFGAGLIVMTSMLWKMRGASKEIIELHNELLEARDETIDAWTEAELDSLEPYITNIRKQRILERAIAVRERLAGTNKAGS